MDDGSQDTLFDLARQMKLPKSGAHPQIVRDSVHDRRLPAEVELQAHLRSTQAR